MEPEKILIKSQDEYNMKLISDIYFNEIEACRNLLESRKISPSLKNEYGCPFIVLAAEWGYKEICALLLEFGAKVDEETRYGATALTCALEGHRLDIAQLLIDNGANVNHGDARQKPLLISMAITGNYEACKLLIKNKADVRFRDTTYGNTALICAASQGHHSICEIKDLAETHELRNNIGRTALMKAACNGHLKCCKVLLDRFASLSQKDVNGSNALTLAALNGHADVCQLLAPYYKNSSDTTRALLLAIQKDHKDTCTVLAPHAKIKFLSESKTPLMWAVEKQDQHLVKLLLENYPQLDAVDAHGNTALILAAQMHDKELCRLIVDHTKNVREGLMTFLCSLKYNQPDNKLTKLFYKHRKIFIKPYFEKELSGLPPSLNQFLQRTNNLNACAYDYLPIDQLKAQVNVEQQVEQQIHNPEINANQKDWALTKYLGNKGKKIIGLSMILGFALLYRPSRKFILTQIVRFWRGCTRSPEEPNEELNTVGTHTLEKIA